MSTKTHFTPDQSPTADELLAMQGKWIAVTPDGTILAGGETPQEVGHAAAQKGFRPVDYVLDYVEDLDVSLLN
jgi:hypothetical protein